MARQRLTILLTTLSVAATLLVGLATNAASARGSWPAWLRPIQDNPWAAMGAVGVIVVAISIVLVRLTDESPPRLVADPAGGPPAAQTPVAVLRALPRDTANFTDRQEEVDRMAAVVLRPRASAGTGLPVQAVNGMAGVGKTTLAVHVGHLLAPHFPDGQVFVDLDGHTPGRRPIRPHDALASLLLLHGVPPQKIPEHEDDAQTLHARSALWRSLVVDKRMLVVLDNAAGYRQVEPIIPGSPGSLVLVTSRRRIVELDDINLTMDVLSLEDGVDLFMRLSQRPVSELDREQVRQVVTLSGRLPLALSILGARFRQHASWSVSDLLRRLADEHDRLREIEAGDRAVAAAFDLSFAQLGPERQRFFLHLGVFPGLNIGADVAAAVAGVPTADADRHLTALYDENLIEEMSAGSYRFHDLLRQYCRDLSSSRLSSDDRDTPLDRVYAFYVERLELADGVIARVAVAEGARPG